jgi:MerR family transcriptional regulator, thiopeptide resistance regulator
MAMAYTVKKLAAMSGVSARTLRFYDEVGLLKPAYHGANGYRFYEEPQLLMLQQILFYRELGFELKQIKRVLGRSDFDKVAALESHREVLRKDVARTRKLIVTIDKTIEHLKGTRTMKSKEMFVGFDPKQQAKHEQYLIDRYGEGMKERIAQSKRKIKDWTKADWENSTAAFAGICKDLVSAMEAKSSADSREVQEIIRRHYKWLKQFWTPNRKSYAGHSQLIVDSDLRKAYEAHHPQLPEFLAVAMIISRKGNWCEQDSSGWWMGESACPLRPELALELPRSAIGI